MAISDLINEWVNGNNYLEGELVSYKGENYKATRIILTRSYEPCRSKCWEKITTEAKIWKEGEAYKRGETVFYKGKQYVAKHNVDIARHSPDRGSWTYIEPNWEVTPNSVERELLIKICNYVQTKHSNEICITGHPLNYLGQISGLVDWWEANKPKSDREIKLEKIQSIICQNITFTVEQQAEEILKLLGK